jgi:hypothetical protein
LKETMKNKPVGLLMGFLLVVSGYWLAKVTVITAVEASGVFALPATVVQTNKINTYGAFKQDMSAATWTAPSFTVAGLPAAAGASGVTVQVTDGNAANDCTTGTGSTIVWCRSNGAAWAPVGGASAGAGTINSGTKGQGTYYAAAGTTVSGFSVTGIPNFRDGVGAPIAALAANIISLFTGCSGVLYLGADGACHSAGGTTLNGFYATTDSSNFFGPIYALTRPSAVSFSWRNQGAATETATGNGALFLVAPANGTDNIRGREITAPATPWTITTLMLPLLNGTNFVQCGMYAADNGTGRIITYLFPNNVANVLQVNQYTNATTFSSTALTLTNSGNRGPFLWMAITDDGTNRLYKWSADGLNFVTVLSETRTTWLATPDRVGYFCDSDNGTWAAQTTLISWSQT